MISDVQLEETMTSTGPEEALMKFGAIRALFMSKAFCRQTFCVQVGSWNTSEIRDHDGKDELGKAT